MKKKQFEYGVQGLLIGLLLGGLLGVGELMWIKKTQKATMAIPVIVVTAIICAGCGYSIGSK